MNAMEYIAAAPEMTLLGLICAVLVADLFVSDEKRVATFWMSMISLAITLWVPLPGVVCTWLLFGWFPDGAIPADPGLVWPATADEAARRNERR